MTGRTIAKTQENRKLNDELLNKISGGEEINCLNDLYIYLYRTPNMVMWALEDNKCPVCKKTIITGARSCTEAELHYHLDHEHPNGK